MLGLIWGFVQRQSLIVWGYLAIVLAVLGILFKVRESGRQAEQIANLKSTLKAVKVRDEITQDISGASDADRKRLREQWTKRD